MRPKRLYQKNYSNIPYLNSSLFEPSDFELKYQGIKQLKPRLEIPVHNSTVLKDINGKRISGNKLTIQYLFEFLDAYNFASDSLAEIQQENKTIINAAVLGLIFEKINGYKDGSFFTPGFITMYMCRVTIRKAVIQKFNDENKWNCKTFEELKDKIEYTDKQKRGKANDIINSIKICDTAVGSGHFLVSSLNELIVIKSELHILNYRDGNRVKGFKFEIANDELIITNEETDELFAYTLNQNNKPIEELQQLQEALFHEKQNLIEKSLFGIDINPKSVLICRLRLWIELLKNSYYTKESNYEHLETLPNIDINIKCGNSLISRFAITDDVFENVPNFKRKLNDYKFWVNQYKETNDKRLKDQLHSQIEQFKNEFKKRDPRLVALEKNITKASEEIIYKYKSEKLFGSELTEKQEKHKKLLEENLQKLVAEKEEILRDNFYQDALEWRFEFPEVLDEDGKFIGFDVVIGNPPYFSISTDEKLKKLSEKYETYSQTGDIYSLFYELANKIQKVNGIQALIISNKWMRANYGINLRSYILNKSNPLLLIDFGQNLIFENAIVHNNIIISKRNENKNELSGIRFEDNKFFNYISTFSDFIEKNKIVSIQFSEEGPWNIIQNNVFMLKDKIEAKYEPLKNWNIKINFGLKTGLNEAFIIDGKKKSIEINRGILTGLNEAFIIDGNLREYILKHEPQSEKFIKPILRGRDTRKYYAVFKDLYLINIPKGYTIKTYIGYENIVMEPTPRYGQMDYDKAWEWFYNNHNAIAKYLFPFKAKAEKREDKGDFWWELRACSYIEAFEKPKIIFSEIVSQPQFYYDEKGYYPEATVFFISGNNLKYLTALLNSKAVTFFFKSFYMGGELVGKIRYKKVFLEQLPLPVPKEEQEKQINNLVDKILSLKEKNSSADTNDLEKEIDIMVYELYNLTEEEIKIVENSNK